MWKTFSLIPSKIFLTRETYITNSWTILQNFKFGMLKFTKTPILPNCQEPNGIFVHHTIQELKFFIFLSSQFLWWVFFNLFWINYIFHQNYNNRSEWWVVFLRERDKIFSTYSGTSYLPDFLTDSSLALKPWPICALPQGYYPHV